MFTPKQYLTVASTIKSVKKWGQCFSVTCNKQLIENIRRLATVSMFINSLGLIIGTYMEVQIRLNVPVAIWYFGAIKQEFG